MTTFYNILDVSHTATFDDIKRAYKLVALQNHPDKTFSLTSSERARREKIFKAATSAYETLSDPEKRRRYDLTLPAANVHVPPSKARSAPKPKPRAETRFPVNPTIPRAPTRKTEKTRHPSTFFVSEEDYKKWRQSEDLLDPEEENKTQHRPQKENARPGASGGPSLKAFRRTREDASPRFNLFGTPEEKKQHTEKRKETAPKADMQYDFYIDQAGTARSQTSGAYAGRLQSFADYISVQDANCELPRNIFKLNSPTPTSQRTDMKLDSSITEARTISPEIKIGFQTTRTVGPWTYHLRLSQRFRVMSANIGTPCIMETTPQKDFSELHLNINVTSDNVISRNSWNTEDVYIRVEKAPARCERFDTYFKEHSSGEGSLTVMLIATAPIRGPLWVPPPWEYSFNLDLGQLLALFEPWVCATYIKWYGAGTEVGNNKRKPQAARFYEMFPDTQMRGANAFELKEPDLIKRIQCGTKVFTRVAAVGYKERQPSAA